MWDNALNYIYVALVVIISVYGLHALILTALYLLKYRKSEEICPEPETWPVVAVQLPLYNEKMVAERMIDTVCEFDYPKDKLIIQVLDDSTDQTVDLVRQRVERYCEQGFNIKHVRRAKRVGFKAGALAEAMEKNPAEFVAVFDADFIPPADYLRKVIPHFYSDSKLGMVQARWGHINRESNVLTQTQSLFLDGHHIVEQVARTRSKLLSNFNGSGGVWRAECINDSGGWTWDTLAEDIDLSFRAQMKGWRLTFLPDLLVPGEVPPTLPIFKSQQYRWVFGHVQVFRKTIFKLWRAPHLTFVQRLAGTFQLSTNIGQVAALLIFLLSVPLALLDPNQPSSLGLISMASSGPSILFAIAQLFGYRNESIQKRLLRLVYLPILVMVSIGLTVSNTTAVVGAMMGLKRDFIRTPKFHLDNNKKTWLNGQSTFTIAPTVWVELAISVYCAIGLSIALRHSPAMIPLTTLGMLSFGLVGASGLFESNRPKKTRKIEIEMAQ